MYEAAEAMFREIKERGYAKLKEWVDNSQEENVHIDFKEKENAATAGLSTDDQQNIRKAVSGFSNVAGGLIVWGISTGKRDLDFADGFRPIQNHRGFAANINSFIPQAALPLNSGIQNWPIDDPDNADQGFVVTYIPYSDRPVRTEGKTDKNFYKRITDNFYQLTVYDIEEMYGRRLGAALVPIMKLNAAGSMQTEEGLEDRSYAISFGFRNGGRGLAKFPFILHEKWTAPRCKRSHGTLTGGADTVIHPGFSLYGPVYHFDVRYYKSGLPYPADPSPDVVGTFVYGCEGQIAKRASVQYSREEFLEMLKNPGVYDITSIEPYM